MVTSVSNLKDRLRNFLSGDLPEQEFRVWFALALRDASAGNDPALESLAHSIQRVFADAADGLYTANQAKEVLSYMAEQEIVPTSDLSARYFVVYVSGKLVVPPLGSTQNAMASSGAYNLLPNPIPVPVGA